MQAYTADSLVGASSESAGCVSYKHANMYT